MGKVFFIVFDGLGDLPSSVLKDQTPLQAAIKPNIDFFAEHGKQGLLTIFKKDIVDFLAENGSNFGYISLFGADPRKVGWSRAPIEAIGIGLDYQKGDLAVRYNYANIDENGFVLDRRAGRVSNEEAKKYEIELNEKLTFPTPFTLKGALRHRGIIILKSSQKLGNNIKGSDPLDTGQKPFHVQPLDRKEENIRSASILRVFEDKVDTILKNSKLNQDRLTSGGYKINKILTRGAGISLPKLPVHDDWAAIATSPVEKGVAKLSKMTLLGIEDPQEDYIKDTDETLEILKKNFNRFDKFMIILKQTDTFGHDGRSTQKKEVIEYADQTLFAFIKENFDVKKDLLIITADHATPTTLMRHAADPIPLLISGKIGSGDFATFNENNCKQGQLGQFMAYDLMKKIYKTYRK